MAALLMDYAMVFYRRERMKSCFQWRSERRDLVLDKKSAVEVMQADYGS